MKLFISFDNVWLVNGSSDRDKERHALDLYQSASAGIPWSPGDACKLVYSSFPCVLFWPNFKWRRRQSHQMDLVYLAPSHLCERDLPSQSLTGPPPWEWLFVSRRRKLENGSLVKEIGMIINKETSGTGLIQVCSAGIDPCDDPEVQMVVSAPSTLAFSLSSHRHSRISLLFSFRFID